MTRAKRGGAQGYPGLLSDTVAMGDDLVIHPNTWHSKRHSCAAGYAELVVPGFATRFVPTYGVARAVQADACELAQRMPSLELENACAVGEAWLQVTCDDYVAAAELVVSRERYGTVQGAKDAGFVVSRLGGASTHPATDPYVRLEDN